MSDMDVLCVGTAALDVIAVLEAFPGPDERVVADTITTAGGGPAATAAVTLARLGVRTGLCAVVGKDLAGDAVLEGLEAEGVDVTGVRRDPQVGTAQSIVLVSRASAARAIVTHQPDPTSIPSPDASTVSWLHADHAGFSSIAAVRSAFPAAGISVDGGNEIPSLDLSLVDLYAPTRRRLEGSFTSMPLEAVLTSTRSLGPRMVVATDGERGSWVASDEGLQHVPAFDIEPVSTLGAGDVFHGALLAAIVRGCALIESVELASAAAALSCEGVDGRSAIPDWERLQRFRRTAARIPPTEHK